jgi:single-strand DNA-binding protein
MNLNKTFIGGNLTRDPELRYTPNGTAICKISIANNRSWKSESGEKKEEVTFVEATAFGRTAETIGQYFKKGRPILIEGRLKLDQWEKDGKKFSKLGVVVEGFQFCGGESSQRANNATSPSESQPNQTEEEPPF